MKLNVNAEEDVFTIILTWIDHDKNKRRKYFAELFREVRLVYISRDFLRSDIVTNDLVNDNEGCIDRVRDAIKFTASKDYNPISVEPRKSLEIPVIVVYSPRLCRIPGFYYLWEDSMTRSDLGKNRPFGVAEYSEFSASCRGKLYFMPSRGRGQITHYDSFSNRWKFLPYTTPRTMLNVFVRNEKEIYALVSEDRSCPVCENSKWVCFSTHEWTGRMSLCGRRHVSVITKYIPESNSWEDITSFDWGRKERMCVVAKDNFIYFLGGSTAEENAYRNYTYETVRDANRYDLNTNTWDKIADLQEARCDACGAAAYGKVFILCGLVVSELVSELKSCEVYNETTNEWHFIASLQSIEYPMVLCADNKRLYVGQCISIGFACSIEIRCYDPDKNEWVKKTTCMPEEGRAERYYLPNCHKLLCRPMRVFKGTPVSAKREIGPFSLSLSHNRNGKCKCTVM